MESDEHCVSRYVLAGGDELNAWFLTSTSDKEQPKHTMNLDGDDVLLEFLRGVMAKGGRVIVEVPGAAFPDPASARLKHPEPKRPTKK